MKKLNKVAMLFASVALAAPMAASSPRSNGHERQLASRPTAPSGRTVHQRTVLARFQLDPGDRAPGLRRRDQAAAAAAPPPPRAGPAAARRRLPRRRPPPPPAAGAAAPSRLQREGDLRRRRVLRLRQVGLKPEGQAKLDDLVAKTKGINLEVIIAVGHTDSDRHRCVQPEPVGAPRRSGQGLPGQQGHREEPRLHRRQGREAAGRRQQDRRRPREEPPRRNRSGRHARATDAKRPQGRWSVNPASAGFFFLFAAHRYIDGGRAE